MPFDRSLLTPIEGGFDRSKLTPIYDEKDQEKEQEEILSRPALDASLSDQFVKDSLAARERNRPARLDPLRLASGPPLPNQIAIDPELSRTAELRAPRLPNAPEFQVPIPPPLPSTAELNRQAATPRIQEGGETPQFGAIVPVIQREDLGPNPGKALLYAGVAQHVVANGLNSLTTPLGLATLASGGLPKAAQVAISLGFAGQMLSQVPEHIRRAIYATDEWTRLTEAGDVGMNLFMGGMAGVHGVRGVKTGITEALDAGAAKVRGIPMPPESIGTTEGVPIRPTEPTPSTPSAVPEAEALKIIPAEEPLAAPTPEPERPRTSEGVPATSEVATATPEVATSERATELTDRLGVVERRLAGTLTKSERPMWELEQQNILYELDSLDSLPSNYILQDRKYILNPTPPPEPAIPPEATKSVGARITDDAKRAINTIADVGGSLTLEHKRRLSQAIGSDPQAAYEYAKSQSERDWEDASFKRGFKRIADFIEGMWPLKESPPTATDLRHPILGLTEKQLSLPSLRTLKARDPELWDKVTKYFGVDKPAEVARIAKERFEQMRKSSVVPSEQSGLGAGAATTPSPEPLKVTAPAQPYAISNETSEYKVQYGVDATVHTWPARKVTLRESPQSDILVYKARSGWILKDNDSGKAYGKERKGIGWIGFDTPEQAVDNYLSKVKPESEPTPPPPVETPKEAAKPKLQGFGTTVKGGETGRYADLRKDVSVGDYVTGQRYVREGGGYNQMEFGKVVKVLKGAVEIERPDGTTVRINERLTKFSRPEELANAKEVFEAHQPKPPNIGPGAASAEEFGATTGNRSMGARIAFQANRITEGLRQLWKRRANKEDVARFAEAADNNAKLTGRTAGNSLRIGATPIQERATTFVMQALKMSGEGQPFEGDPEGYLRDGISRIRAKDKEAAEAAEYALYHFDDLLDNAERANRQLTAQIRREWNQGIDTEYEKWYVPQRHEMDMLPGPNRPVILGESRGGTSTGFKKAKTFPDYFSAIEAGFKPKSLSIGDLVEHRVTTGERLVNRKKWVDQFRDVVDPVDQKPIVTEIERRSIPRPDGTVDVQYSSPLGYRTYEVIPGTRVAVHEGYARLFDALTARSQLAESAVGQAALKAATTLKSGLLLFDTFHVSRVAQSELGLRGRLGWNKGHSLLEYADADLQRAVDANLITPEMAQWVRDNRPTAKLLINNGLNVARIHQNLYREWIENLPVIGATNKWIFEKMTRGAMLESALGEFNRLRSTRPEMSDAQIAKQVSKDINVFYSNLGKQGFFKNPTMRDALRIIFLAPEWVEGLARREGRAIFQAGKAIGTLATTGQVRIDTTVKGLATGLAAYFVATQLVNLFSRGQFTWQNPEEGHKLDAFVPDVTGKSKGFFLSPLSVFAEVTHDLLRYGQKKPTVAEAFTQFGYNKLSPLGRAAATITTGRDVFGDKIATTAGRALEAGRQMIPTPIPLTGFTSERPGAVQRQAMSAVGLKTEPAPSANQQLAGMVRQFQSQSTDPRVQRIFQQHEAQDPAKSGYNPLRDLLRQNSIDQAREEYKRMLDSGYTQTDIMKAMLPTRPITGSRVQDMKFRRSLSPEQRQVLDAAIAERRELWTRFQTMLRHK